MRENGLERALGRRFRRTTDSRHRLPVAPNLLERRFTASAPNQAEGGAYLPVLLDLYSRRVVGWALRKLGGSALPFR
jgi:transposase InsO family protein